ncbi:MAG: CAP domain-containing protein [Verrucomicrobiales bacterium]
MKTLLLSLLLLAIPAVDICHGVPTTERPAAAPKSDPFRIPAEPFAKHPPAQRLLDRAKLDHRLLSAAIFHATNRQRTAHKFPPLVHSEALSRAAQGHSNAMAAGGFFAHDNPKDRDRKTMKQRLELEGIKEGFRSENIAKTPVQGLTYLSAADAMVAQWMKSRRHRNAILDRKMLYLGCGGQVDPLSPHFYILGTQNFASSLPP